MRSILISLTTVSVAALPLIAAAAPVAAQQAQETKQVQQDPDTLLAPPEKPLDDRVAAEKVTEYDPPPLPRQVILPKPPDFRLAANASELPISFEHYAKGMAALRRGLDFLELEQDQRGAWLHEAMAIPTDEPDKPSPVGVAVTAMAVKGFMQHDPDWINTQAGMKAMRYILGAQEADGSFSAAALTNYVTSSVVSALASVKDVEYRDAIQDGIAWLKQSQWDQSEGLKARQDWFGGAGYGNRGRPDMSNTQMMLDAMYDAQVSPDEPAMQKALAFVSRAQNLNATNSAQWAGNDGGFIYTPANNGESMASEASGEGRYGENFPEGTPRSLRSYGSMTYAGFKSMLYAGLSPDDIRVRAAFDWIRKHYTFDENPGIGLQGLYYYYHTMGRALNVAQQHIIADEQGVEHNWREDLIDALVQRQNSDGSWVNDADRWLEGEPVMATVYSVLALEEVLKPALMLEGD